MERKLWPVLYRAVRQVGRQMKQKGVRYQPWMIAAVMLWAALHDRPRNWACVKANWSSTKLRLVQLPSPSVLSRRVDSVGMGIFWRMLEEALRGTAWSGLISIVDGKPLCVGGCSKDPEARLGYGADMMGRGYKLHAIWSSRMLPEAWDVTPMNHSEAIVAGDLVTQLRGGGYLLADGSYDTNALHDQSGERGYQLLAKDRRKNAGQGHRRQSPFRCRGMELRNSHFGRELLKHRSEIERDFAHATNFGGGLCPLPGWVRRRHRVRTWVWCKLLINAARLAVNQGLVT
jgi:hypothetical protein